MINVRPRRVLDDLEGRAVRVRHRRRRRTPAQVLVHPSCDVVVASLERDLLAAAVPAIVVMLCLLPTLLRRNPLRMELRIAAVMDWGIGRLLLRRRRSVEVPVLPRPEEHRGGGRPVIPVAVAVVGLTEYARQGDLVRLRPGGGVVIRSIATVAAAAVFRAVPLGEIVHIVEEISYVRIVRRRQIGTLGRAVPYDGIRHRPRGCRRTEQAGHTDLAVVLRASESSLPRTGETLSQYFALEALVAAVHEGDGPHDTVVLPTNKGRPPDVARIVGVILGGGGRAGVRDNGAFLSGGGDLGLTLRPLLTVLVCRVGGGAAGDAHPVDEVGQLLLLRGRRAGRLRLGGAVRGRRY
mmetsp:Transcript_29139/g.86237  ORF Transcript_29139/g.86237 Transcript_29139/m.86237 type:complete len:351 (-) Transcript_29139:369-1421(-)